MWKVEIPSISGSDSFKTCVNGYATAIKKNKLLAAADELLKDEEVYKSKGKVANLYQISPKPMINGNISVAEMKLLYKSHMQAKNSAGRKIYDAILSAPKFNICPLCGHRIASQIDHYLPVSVYSSYSVCPINLVPACKDCNFIKLNLKATSKEKQTIHPYFDDISSKQWLFASVIESYPMIITFKAVPPKEWPKSLKARVKFHFETLELNNLYTSNAGAELSGIRDTLTNLYNSGGPDLVRVHLKENFSSRSKANVNSWQTAFYQGLYLSDWLFQADFLGKI